MVTTTRTFYIHYDPTMRSMLFVDGLWHLESQICFVPARHCRYTCCNIQYDVPTMSREPATCFECVRRQCEADAFYARATAAVREHLQRSAGPNTIVENIPYTMTTFELPP